MGPTFQSVFSDRLESLSHKKGGHGPPYACDAAIPGHASNDFVGDRLRGARSAPAAERAPSAFYSRVRDGTCFVRWASSRAAENGASTPISLLKDRGLCSVAPVCNRCKHGLKTRATLLRRLTVVGLRLTRRWNMAAPGLWNPLERDKHGRGTGRRLWIGVQQARFVGAAMSVASGSTLLYRTTRSGRLPAPRRCRSTRR